MDDNIQKVQDNFNAIGALLGLLGVWLGREICTIGSNGGVVGLWKYFWFGIKPSTIIPEKVDKKDERLQSTDTKTT